MTTGFANYETQSVCDKNTIIETKNINKNVSKEVEIIVKDSINTLIEKGSKIDTTQNVIYSQELKAPLKKGDVVGKIEMLSSSDNSIIGSSDLIINQDVEKSGFFDYFKKIFRVYLLRN